MASRVEPFAITIPAGTASGSPLTTATRFDEAQLDRIEILVPPGPSGLVGFRIAHGGGGVFPREDSRWIIADGEKIAWDNDTDNTAGDWAVVAYNEDVFDHTLYFRFLVTEIGGNAPTLPLQIPITQPNQVAPVARDPGFPTGESR